MTHPRGTVLTGIGVSAGAGVGPVALVGDVPTAPADEPGTSDPAAAWEQVAEALAAVADELDKRAVTAGGAGSPAASILQATALMARDPQLATSIRSALAGGAGPATAVHRAVEDVCAMFTAVGGYLAERTTDLRDLGGRVIAHLLGLPQPGVPRLERPSVLVARDLAPADTAGLDPSTTLAIVTELGGPTSHTAILAAQLGIPAVVHAGGALGLTDGELVAVDGSAGTVTVGVDAAEAERLRIRAADRARRLASVRGAGRTADGHPVALLANIGTVGDARVAADADVEGVGLFRTEFLFLDRTTAPTVQEQTEAYTQVLTAFDGRPVTVRTLDAGADKQLPFAGLAQEENPALGVRGLRLGRRQQDLLDDQLAALARAQRATGARLKVMAPMVSTVPEARWFAARAADHGLSCAGVMVEVPAAAVRARTVLREVAFASIGTNDLAQYTVAADRLAGELADLLDPWQPAVLELVATTAAAGIDLDRPVGVCGESAGDPLLALVLTGLGVRSLSMAPGRVPAVRYALAAHSLAACRELAAAALAAEDATAALAAVTALVEPSVRELG